jgi:hypothetical protein
MATGSDLELQKLREQLRQAEERAGQAEARAGQAEARARDEQANRLRAERQVEEERIRNENTTFRDFLKLCHSALFRPILTQADKTLTTKGSITSPKGRKCPTFLRPWDDFPTAQLQYFDDASPDAPMKSPETGPPEANQAPFRTRNWPSACLFLGHPPHAVGTNLFHWVVVLQISPQRFIAK